MDIDVQVTARGDVGRRMKEYAQHKVAHAARLVRDPVLFARVKLLVEPDPARERPVLAAAVLDVDGIVVRAHAPGHDLQEAIDLLEGHLRDELEHLTDRRQALRKRGPEPRAPHEWRHGYAPARRPPYFDRRAEERQVVRHKTYALHALTVAEAVDEMQRMAYDFHLFVCRDTGLPCVVGQRPDGRVDVASLGDLPSLEPWMLPAPTPASTLTVEDAKRLLDLSGAPYVLFRDVPSKIAGVLYRRYDGHYGLVTAGEAKPASASVSDSIPAPA